MTLTVPSCPRGQELVEGVATALLDMPGIRDVDVTVTFNPRWTPDRLSPEAKKALSERWR